MNYILYSTQFFSPFIGITYKYKKYMYKKKVLIVILMAPYYHSNHFIFFIIHYTYNINV